MFIIIVVFLVVLVIISFFILGRALLNSRSIIYGSSHLCPAPDSIPPILIQTYKRPLPKPMRVAMDTWTTHNPWLRTRFYDDEACVSFLRKHFPARVLTAYASLRPPAFRADLFRYAALFVHGGFYADAPMVCHKPMPNWMRSAQTVLVLDDTPKAIYNAFMGLPPGHPVAAAALSRAVENIEARLQPKMSKGIMRCIDVTGPGCLWASRSWATKARNKKWVWGRHSQNNSKLGHGCVIFHTERSQPMRLSDVQAKDWNKKCPGMIGCKYPTYDDHRTETHHWFKHCLDGNVYVDEKGEERGQ